MHRKIDSLDAPHAGLARSRAAFTLVELLVVIAIGAAGGRVLRALDPLADANL